jgi:hypothetical protein
MVIFSSAVSCNVIDLLALHFVGSLAENAGTRVYLEAATYSGVEVRHLAEDVLVHFLLAIPTDDGEVREFSALEESRRPLARRWGRWNSTGDFRASRPSKRT